MPMWKGWLPREGFSSEVLGTVFKNTLFNPALTLPLILLARYTKKGEDLSILHKTAYGRIKFLFYLGLARWANNYLSTGALNNWTKDDYDWEKEIVIVTGGSGGIGGHVVQLLAERNITVIVLDVIPMTYEAPANVHYFKCDITSTSTIAAVAREIRSTIGVPTVLVNNAGVARGKSILDATEKDVRFTFDVNTMSHYFLAKEFVPAMVARNHGMVVTVASIAAYLPVAGMVDYAASKAAALTFHEGLTAELKSRYKAPKVRTVVINQGYTKTALFQGYQNDSKFMMPTLEPETVAEEISKKILSGMSGQVIMPGYATVLCYLRGFPHWMQSKTRNDDAANIMTNWHGRQVIDVDKDYKIKGAQEANVNGESSSTVLVPPAAK